MWCEGVPEISGWLGCDCTVVAEHPTVGRLAYETTVKTARPQEKCQGAPLLKETTLELTCIVVLQSTAESQQDVSVVSCIFRWCAKSR